MFLKHINIIAYGALLFTALNVSAGVVASRNDLNNLLGKNLALEDFEKPKINIQMRYYLGALTYDTNAPGLGKHLVKPGIAFQRNPEYPNTMDGYRGIDWNPSGYFGSTSKSLSGAGGSGGESIRNDFQFVFTKPVTSFGVDLWAYSSFPSSATASIYDPAGKLIAEVDVTGAVGGNFFGWEHADGIGKIAFHNTPSGSYMQFDNVGFGTGPEINPNWDQDKDGILDVSDTDDDNDGITDKVDFDDDNDGTPDNLDFDDDNDGIADKEDITNTISINDRLDNYDDDQDGITDSFDFDSDNDGTPNRVDKDDDNDGIVDSQDFDDDNDGVKDSVDTDDDNDGIADQDDKPGQDVDDDNILASVDLDDDNDGILDELDDDDNNNGVLDSEELLDSDEDGISDAVDADDDNDGLLDKYDTDADNDGIVDSRDTDADNDGIADQVDFDSNNDGVDDKT